jgi:hypothetical protein
MRAPHCSQGFNAARRQSGQRTSKSLHLGIGLVCRYQSPTCLARAEVGRRAFLVFAQRLLHVKQHEFDRQLDFLRCRADLIEHHPEPHPDERIEGDNAPLNKWLNLSMSCRSS